MKPYLRAYGLLLLVLLVFPAGIIKAQALRSSSEASYHNSSQRLSSTLNFRIENGKCWINGNMVPEKDLPEGLQNLDESIYYTTSVFGMSEISFLLYGKEYLVKADRIVELEATQRNQGYVNTPQRQQAAEEYYSQLKRESPALFYSMSREGALYEQCRSLMVDYQKAKSKDRDKIREDIRLVLGQLFDLNERNRELEIRQLEQMIDAAKKEVSFRKANKGVIIDNALEELLDE